MKNIKVKVYTNEELPDHLKWQVLSFLRVQWPDGFEGKNQYRDWISKPSHHPIHVVLHSDNLLISYACVVWKNLTHASKTFKTYGLSGVFTYPSFRNQGHGLRVITAAQGYIKEQDGDIVLFTSHHKGFYEKAGFERIDDAVIFEGDDDSSPRDDGHAFMLFLSKKAQDSRKAFRSQPVYFGETMW